MPEDDFLKPLCPLRDETFDYARYLPIDSSQENFNEFSAKFDKLEGWASKGHLVIVAGDTGYGRTSLMQRCAAWLRDQASDPKWRGTCEVVTIDLSDEGLRVSFPIPERIRETLNYILEALGNRITREQRKEMKESDSSTAFRILGRLLNSRLDGQGNPLPPIVVVVLLRRYSLPDEIEEYYNLARRGMVFFAEAFQNKNDAGGNKNLEIREKIAGFNRHEVDCLLLELDVLKPGDVVGLIHRILEEARNLPNVPSSMINEIEEGFIPTRMSAGELARMASGALRIAAAEAAAELTSVHIYKYYRMGPR